MTTPGPKMPEWVENVDAIGMSEQEGFDKLKKALAIAWEALHQCYIIFVN